MPRQKRPYTLRKRAESQEETRLHIVEATMHLHEEIGPRETTISAIAERAGVQRLTVYRHFPDEAAVFRACTEHWLSLNPLPDPAEWERVDDPILRMRTALAAFYRYYGATERMWVKAYRDVGQVPALQKPMKQVADYMKRLCGDLTRRLSPAHDNAALAATVHHAFAFSTWASLGERGLSGETLVDTVMRWVESTIVPDRPR
jgi:AcrR family transcriptional regulator